MATNTSPVPIVQREKEGMPTAVLLTGRNKSRIRHSVQEIEQALRDANGFVSAASRNLRITSRGLRKRIQSDKRLQRVLEDIREEQLDMTESQLHLLIKEKNLGAIIWHLKCRGRHRGWVDREDFNAPVNETVLQPPTIIINFVSPKKKENEPLTIPTRLGD